MSSRRDSVGTVGVRLAIWRVARRLLRGLVMLSAPAIGSCGGTVAEDGMTVRTTRAPVVYGDDGRVELADVGDARLRDLARARVVALMPVETVTSAGDTVTVSAPTLGESANLCPGVRFADQPAAAFCSGILVGRQTVLTAGHCLRHVPCEQTAFVTGYAEGSSGLSGEFVGAALYACESVLGREVSLPGETQRVDYAWVHLDRPVEGSIPALGVRDWEKPLVEGAPVTLVGFSGGVPMKVNEGGVVGDVRSDSQDYFLTTSDAFHGDSGAPVFDSDLRLLGIEARGNGDYTQTTQGCNDVTVLGDAAQAAGEQVTYARRALEDLCVKVPDAEPCPGAVPARSTLPPGGCATSPARGASNRAAALAVAAALIVFRRRTGSHCEKSLVVRWWKKEPFANVAIATGTRSMLATSRFRCGRYAHDRARYGSIGI